MKNRQKLEEYFKQIQVVRAPKRRLATFASSRIDYQLVTEVPGLPDRSRLRLGIVTAERPQIIMARHAKDRFEGFGPDAAKYADALVGHYGEALRGLEYQFKNQPESSRIELRRPDDSVKELASRHDNDGGFHTAVIRSLDKFWELGLMKFIVEETLASFASNVRELHEHGFFDTEDDILQRKHQEIQALFQQAQTNKAAISKLASKLKDYGLFDTYQDRFFQLVGQ